MFKKFRKNLRVDKKRTAGATLEVEADPSYCHHCGQRTPTRSTFGAASTHSGDRMSWNGSSSASDSGYGSIISSSSSSSQRSSPHIGDSHTMDSIPPPPPSRRTTYSSSVYSNDAEPLDALDHMPMTVEEADEDIFDLPPVTVSEYHEHFNLPPRTLSSYSQNFVAKSRYARLNELPAASPRALVFSEDVFDLDAGIELDGSKQGPADKRKSWHRRGTSRLSVSSFSQLRRLSLGNSSKA